MSRREPSWRRYLTFWRPTVDRDVDDEIRFHFDERVEDLRARGRSEAQARAEAEEEFGDRQTYRDRMREIDRRRDARRNRSLWIDALRADLRLTLRSMRRAPAISLTVITLLALGIGANGAVFSMLDRIFLRPAPGIARPAEMRRLWGHYEAPAPARGFTSPAFNYPEMSDVSRAIGPSIALVGFTLDEARMGGTETSPMLNVASVIGDYFGTLGVRPALGRLFAADELGVTAPYRLVVISHRLWTHTFGGDSTIIGREIRLARQSFTVIGVAASGFDGVDLDAVDAWRPANYQSTGSTWYQRRGGGEFQVIFRMPPDFGDATVTKRANDGLHSADDASARRTTIELGSIIAARGPHDADQDARVAVAVGAVTLIVLLIAVANVGNLLLTRAIERRREVAVRLALGISRRRLAAQVLTESAVLAVAAGIGATAIGAGGGLLLRTMLMPTTRWSDRLFDFRLVLFTFATALIAGLAAGVLPLMQTRSLDLAASMRGGVREGSGHRSRTRGSLIVAQAALSVILLTGAVLFLRSLKAVRALDIGFDASGMIVARVLSGDRAIAPPERDLALQAIRERVGGLPGVRAAGLANQAPMAGFSSERFFVPGRDSQPRGVGGGPTFQAVSPEFFRAAGVSIVAGRSFTDDDRPDAPSVAIITRTMARFIWGSANAVGQCFRLEMPTAACTTVVGVMEDLRLGEVIEESRLQFYLPLAQAGGRRYAAALIVGADPRSIPAIESELRSIIRQTVPGGIAEVTTLASRLEPQFRPWRVGASLFAAFGALALLVASIGIYSSISYTVTRRSHELGVRMALGAPRTAVARTVIGSGVRVVAAGVAIGMAASIILGGPARAVLYETNPRDPAVLIAVAALLLTVAVIAAARPAWRASRLDPVRALRAE